MIPDIAIIIFHPIPGISSLTPDALGGGFLGRSDPHSPGQRLRSANLKG